MCDNLTCPLKETCYRFKAVPSEYQAYANFELDDDGKCDYFIKIKN